MSHDTISPLQRGIATVSAQFNCAQYGTIWNGYTHLTMLDIIITLAEAFRAQQKQLYMVGGTVRDGLLHRGESNDADLATDAHPDEIKRIVAPTHPSAIVLVGERFGTVRLHYSQNIIEITTFRSERYNPVSRKPEVCFGTVLEDDLLRRDFTINAMACHPLTGEIIDPFGGRQDLEAHLLRAVGNEPDKRFDEDPLRLLRGVRFAAQLDFTLERETRRSIARQSVKLQKISRERIRDAPPSTDLPVRIDARRPGISRDGCCETWVMREIARLRIILSSGEARALIVDFF